MVNTRQLRALMVANDVRMDDVAKALGRTKSIAYNKISGRSEMTLEQAEAVQALLGIRDEDFAFYFMSHERSA